VLFNVTNITYVNENVSVIENRVLQQFWKIVKIVVNLSNVSKIQIKKNQTKEQKNKSLIIVRLKINRKDLLKINYFN
jgi:hypothetical protein